jgi:hypothetical protein
MRLSFALVVTTLFALVPAASAREARQAIVVVRASGSTDLWGQTQHFGYGVVLQNRSATRDALGVRVHVAVLSRNGAVIGIYLTTVPRVPAGGTFYLGNEPATIGNRQHAASIVVGVATSGTQARTGPLPSGRARVSGTRIAGTITNLGSRRLLTRDTRIFAVYYDARGKVIGGIRLERLRFPHHVTVAPHASAGFSAGPGSAVAPGRIAKVEVSVVPKYAAG